MTLAPSVIGRTWTRALLYLRTVIGLRPRQGLHLLAHRLRSRVRRPPAPVVASFAPASLARVAAGLWSAGPGNAEARRSTASQLAEGRVVLLGTEVELATLDWAGNPVSPLWAYHLHYLDWAVDLAWAYRLDGDPSHLELLIRLFSVWESATRSRSSPAWDPYPHATRSLNLVRVAALIGEPIDSDLVARLSGAVGAFVTTARQDLEVHLQGNHLWRDVAAWVVAAEVLEGTQWERSRQQARYWWARIRREQLLSDGGHEERSPLYHALAVQDLALTLLAVPPGETRNAILADGARMLPVLSRLVRPDGSPHLFNDSAGRDDLDPAAIVRLVTAAGLTVPEVDGPFHLPATGYAGVISPGGGDRLIIDCGRPAPRHQPAHLHCDLLAFEYDLRGRPLLVNCGVRGYDGEPLRNYFRGTSSHNTVQIGRWDQSELWGVFRVGRMARVLEHAAASSADGGWSFKGAMSPYRPAGAVHRRSVDWRPGRLEIGDVVEGIGDEECRAYLHFAPEVEVHAEGTARFRADLGGAQVTVLWEGAANVQLLVGTADPPQGWYAGTFGSLAPAPCLVATFRGRPRAELRCVIQEIVR